MIKINNNNCFATKCPEILKDWNFDKNTISPYNVFKNSKQIVFWKCYKCQHEWTSMIKSRALKNSKCKKCCGKLKLTIEDFIKRSNKIHGNKYSYSLSIYTNIDNKIKIICNTCNNIFEQIAWNHLAGQGCPKCRYIKMADKNRKSVEYFIEKAILIHGNKYNYDNVCYKGREYKINIFCNICNNLFNQTAGAHLAGQGCSRCCFKGTSKKENQWLNMLNISENDRQISIKLLNSTIVVDAYIKEINTIYEFHGDFWHGNPSKYKSNHINKKNKKTFGELYKKTMERERLIKEAGYNLITIWESDFDIIIKHNNR